MSEARLLIYLLHDPEGYADLAVLRTLQAFRSVADHVLVVSKGPLLPESKSDLEKVADEVLVRENTGYDIGAHRAGLEHIGQEGLENFNELVLANSTFFSVQDDFKPLFERMASSDADFWGLTDHPQVTPNPFTGVGTLDAHLQTYWVVVRDRMLHDPLFFDYWQETKNPESYAEAVSNFESRFSKRFADLGFSWRAAFPAKDFGVENPTMQAPLALLDQGFPIVKKRLYFHGTEHLMNLGVSVARVTEAAVARGVSREVIMDAVARRTEADQVSVALGALYVAPASSPRLEPKTLKWSVTSERPWKTLAADPRPRPRVAGGVDAEPPSSEIFAADVLFVRPPTPHPPRADGDLWRRQNALRATGNEEFVVSLMEGEARLGMIAPTLQFVGSAESDIEWLTGARRAWTIAEMMGLQERASHHGPVAAYEGVAVYRTAALSGFGERIREAGGWEKLTAIAGAEDAHERILDQLIADHMRLQACYAGRATTSEELQVEAPLWMVEAQAHFARFKGYSEYMHNWKVLPSSPSRGQAFWARSGDQRAYSVLEGSYRRFPGAYLVLNRLYNKVRDLREEQR